MANMAMSEAMSVPLELVSLNGLKDGVVGIKAPSEDEAIQLNSRPGIPLAQLIVAKQGNQLEITREDGSELQIAMTWPYGALPGEGRRDMAFLTPVNSLLMYEADMGIWVPEGPIILDAYGLLKFCKLAAAHAVYNQRFGNSSSNNRSK